MQKAPVVVLRSTVRMIVSKNPRKARSFIVRVGGVIVELLARAKSREVTVNVKGT